MRDGGAEAMEGPHRLEDGVHGLENGKRPLVAEADADEAQQVLRCASCKQKPLLQPMGAPMGADAPMRVVLSFDRIK